MKKIIYTALCVIFSCVVFVSYAQAPQSFKYQSVARSSDGTPKANSNIGLRINIHDLTETGTVVYQETHTALTNAFGLFSISVGAGSVVSGTFSTLSWGSGAKFIEVEADFSGGTSYTSMGTSQLLSVPYALYSQSGNGGTPGTNGLNILNGTTDPTPAIGLDGEFYVNTTSTTLFGPKASGAWPAGVSLIGPAAWTLTGNAGTVDGTNFIGTTDNVPLNFKVNNEPAGKIDPVGWGTFFGYRAGQNNTPGVGSEGSENVGLGFMSLNNNTTGSKNTAVGHQSSYFNRTGDRNASLGYNSFYSNTTGTSNTAIGENSLYENLSGNFNTGVGSNSLYENTTGLNNSALGYYSLYNNSIGEFNTAVGSNSLNGNTTGNFNTGIGGAALFNTNGGSYNTSLGGRAGFGNITGSNNTFIGYDSGPDNFAQLTNATAIGYHALVSSSNSLVLGGTAADAVKVGIGVTAPAATLDIAGNIKIADGTQGAGKVLASDANGLASWTTIGYLTGWVLTGNSGTVDGTDFIGTTDNVPLNFRVNSQKAGRITSVGQTFIGYRAGEINTDLYGTGVGHEALLSNTTGAYNCALGIDALHSNTTGSENTALGSSALFTNTTGNLNTAVGFSSLLANTGFFNTSVGAWSLTSNTTGNENIAMGVNAMYSNTIGNDNVGIGKNAMYYSTTGNYNTAVGSFSLNSNIGGASNTSIGRYALGSNTSGNNNTSVGSLALNANTTGSNNTALGYNAFLSGASYSNSTAIGYNAQVTASNMIRLGDANITSINGAVGFTVVSDSRFKKDIVENVAGLNFIMKLRPVTYHIDPEKMAQFMNTPEKLRSKESELAKEKILQTGFIAQEVEQAAKNAGYDFSGVDKPENDKDYYGLRYAEFTVPLVKAVQEQQAMIETLRKEIQTLKEENSSLKETIESRLKKLEASLSNKETENKSVASKP